MPDDEEVSKSRDEQAAKEGIFTSLAKGAIKGVSVAICRIQVSDGIS